MTLKLAAQQLIRDRRRSAPMRFLANAAQKYLNVWNNVDFYEFGHNGERFALSCFADWAEGKPVKVWDVGAHRGEWSDEALKLLPAAEVHCFEAIPSIARDIPSKPNRVVHAIGLSDREGEAEIYHSAELDTLNSLQPYLKDPSFAEAQRIPCKVSTGDAMIAEIGCPHFLKIDVEGSEVSVLRGCQGMLKSDDAPAMLQIEYGHTYLASGSSLMEVYRLLPCYSIGRLFPNHVDFKDYHYDDDKYMMGNLIAVRDAKLKSALAG